MSFTHKKITAVITLGSGNFAVGGNQVVLTGLRIVADINKAGGISFGTAQIRIYGLRYVDMNQLTQLAFHPLQYFNNTIDLMAGNDETGMSLAYSGDILSAAADYQSAPDVPLVIEAQTGYYALLNAAPPSSFKGATDVSTIVKTLAQKAGFTFENNGVQSTLANPYLPGSAMNQIQACAKAADIDMYLDDKILAICPKGQARATNQIPLISKDTGMIGYPTFDKIGINFKSLYNPAIRFGSLVQIQSDVVVTANGQWRMVSVGHLLESERPGGAWFTTGLCTDNAVAIVP